MDKLQWICFHAVMRHLFMKRFLLAALISFTAGTAAPAADMFVYFGSHRSGPNIGFSLAHFDTDTGALTKREVDAEKFS